jgi:iron(II)-dependent oxidoreductase
MRRGSLIVLLVVLFALALCTSQRHPAEAPEGMVLVPAGWFRMGEDDGRASNQPAHSVYLNAFAIDRTEITQAAFAQFVAATDAPLKSWSESEGNPNDPATGVVWREAEAYCRWVGKRLPTEAEWEKAARGEDGRRYPWGDVWEAERCNTADSGRGRVMPVGSLPRGASPYGALDMAGNAAEWVADYFDAAYYTIAPDHNPTGPNIVVDHGLRGGSWASPSEHAQTFFRDSSHSVEPNPRLGFRCALSVQK